MTQPPERSFNKVSEKLELIQFSLPSPNGAQNDEEFVRVRIPDLFALAEARVLLRQSGSNPIDLGYRCIITSESGVALLRKSGITIESAEFLDDKQKRAEVAAQDLGPDWVRSLQLPHRHA